MSKTFSLVNLRTLAIIAIVGLGFGSVTPVAHAEAPAGNSYLALSPIESLHATIASSLGKEVDEQPVDIIVDGLTQAERAAKIEQFFRSRENSPMADYAMDFVIAADKYGIDWKLVPAISTIESNGGHMACKFKDGSLKYNAFGWGGCTIAFGSYHEAIDVITKNLAGLEPKTEKYYKGKTVDQIIDTYNPPHVRDDYNELVTWAMKKIASTGAFSTANQIAMN